MCEIFEDMFGLPISAGTCAKVDEQLFKQLETFEQNLKTHLLANQVLHFDETGMRCEKKLHWVHVTSSQSATLYIPHPKRGQFWFGARLGALLDDGGIDQEEYDALPDDHPLKQLDVSEYLDDGIISIDEFRELKQSQSDSGDDA